MGAHSVRLVKTCDVCPEQYDALDDEGNIIGYLRFRFGYFAVYCPNADAETPVYQYVFKQLLGAISKQ